MVITDVVVAVAELRTYRRYHRIVDSTGWATLAWNIATNTDRHHVHVLREINLHLHAPLTQDEKAWFRLGYAQARKGQGRPTVCTGDDRTP